MASPADPPRHQHVALGMAGYAPEPLDLGQFPRARPGRWFPFRHADWLAQPGEIMRGDIIVIDDPWTDVLDPATLDQFRERLKASPLWSSRRHSQHIMGSVSFRCVNCGFPIKGARSHPGPSYCSWRWTGRAYDAPTPADLACAAYAIIGWGFLALGRRWRAWRDRCSVCGDSRADGHVHWEIE